MSTTEKQSIPWWAWAFAAACIAIPIVAIGGAIPGALGAGGAGACVAIARNSKKSVGARLALCAVVTLVCWGAFGGLAWNVFNRTESKKANTSTSYESKVSHTTTTIHGQPKEALNLDDEEARRELYRYAAKYWHQIQDRQQERNKLVLQGKNTDFIDTSIARLEGYHDKRTTYCCERRGINRAQLESILAEGDREGW